MTHEFEDANLAFTRDLFVFMNFTALSFVDLFADLLIYQSTGKAIYDGLD